MLVGLFRVLAAAGEWTPTVCYATTNTGHSDHSGVAWVLQLTDTIQGRSAVILIDRRKLKRLMREQGVTHRDLAEVAGYRAHSYIGRLVRGEVNSLGTDPALRIAHRLGVPVEALFFTGPTSNYGHDDRKTRRAS